MGKTKKEVAREDNEISELNHARKVICARLERFAQFLHDNKEDIFQIEIRLKSVEEDFSEFDKIQTRLEYLVPEENENRLDTESAFYSKIALAKKFIADHKKLNDKIEQNRMLKDLATPESGNRLGNLASFQSYSAGGVARLPDLGLPSFYGKYETWYSFKDIFDSLVNNRVDLSEIDKFLYLKLCCKGDALKLIDSLNVTTANYSIALDLLQKRYENKRAIINHHVNTLLFNLPQVPKESAAQIRILLDSVHQNTTALKKMQIPVEHWDLMLIPIILQKMDDRTKREWETKQTDQKLPTLNELIEYLTKKCFILEAMYNNNNPNLKVSRNYDKGAIQKSNTKCFLTEQYVQNYPNSYNREIKCCVCQESHFIYHCSKFSNMPMSEKYTVIRQLKLCNNCLRSGHSKNDCLSSGCKKCKLKHNTLLHIDRNYEIKSNHGNTAYLSRPISQPHEILADTRETQNSNRNQSVYLHPPKVLSHNESYRPPIDRENNNSVIEINETKNSKNNEPIVKEMSSGSYSSLISNQVLLSTATVLVSDKKGNWHESNTLLDSGSQSHLISNSLCEKLGLKRDKINIPLSGINQMVTNISYKTQATIKSKFDTFQTSLSFLVLSKITEKLPTFRFEKSKIKYPRNINLADERFNIPKEIDMLLGAGIFYELLLSGRIRLGENMPTLHETRLGWIFTGVLNFNANQNNQKVICNLSTKVTNKDLNDTLTKFWTIEELSNETFLSKDEQICENYFTKTTTRNHDGKFIVQYPFRETIENLLGDSKTIALKRFNNLEKRFNKQEGLKQQYVDFMKEYEGLGHMTFKCNLDNDNSTEHKSYFLPHTAVLRDSVTTNCRVVFDASAKTSSDVSLNDLLLTGPNIQPDLFSILLRLRLRKIVLISDIKMMYRCILINPKERDFQQILWRENTNEPVKVFTLNTVTYGTSSAPFQATRCLKELALLNEEKYPRTSKLIQNSFYMDDMLVSVNSKKEAIEIYHELTEILSQAKFDLRKWSSNDKTILNYILEKSEIKDDKLVLFHEEKDLKTLGISWDANEDKLKYSINVAINEKKVTKRTVLSTISQIFDPLGLVGPVIITAKLFIQELWQQKFDWDQDIPNYLKERWLQFVSELEILNQISIKRHVLLPHAVTIELYGFSDSSEKAYGACVYLCSIDKNGDKVIRLLTAKSKVAPLKQQTLPRLELLAAHLLAVLVNKIKFIIDLNISKCSYFTDSTIVLAWLKIEPNKLKTFVANRISKITQVSNVESWKHVRSSDNPADIISRGFKPKELLESDMWFNGPKFLRTNEYLKNTDEPIISDTIPELKINAINLSATEKSDETELKIFEKYSSFFKLSRVIACIYRFKNRTLKKIPVKSKVLSVEELREALLILIRLAQQESFKTEILDLRKFKKISNESKILNLNPFLDSENILRIGGRLMNSKIEFDHKHPIILPYKHKLTDLIIRDMHLKHLHAGIQNLLSIIRLKFWIINGKNAVKRVIKSCLVCYRVNPKPGQFLMGSLPSERVNPSRPFSNCGVDYAGPIFVKEGTLRRSKLVKTYICIFVCFATRAVHIELVQDLTTNSFLNALKRFCARRGKPSNIHSDNGSNFVGANNYFIELYHLINDEAHNNAISSFLAGDRVKWHFIPARSAHVGGLWEAAVKSTKFHLKRVIGEASLNFEEMYTILVQIESCLNSRPLTPLSTDVNDYAPLTPSHFLIGDSLASCPEAEFLEIKISRLSRYQRLQQLYQQFWDRWSKEYLTSLQTRSKWKKDIQNSLKTGTLVVLVENNLPPLRWPMARVIELHPGKDNVVRVVSVRMANGAVLRRSVAKICVLPVDTES